MSKPPIVTSLLSCDRHGLTPGYVICSCVLLFSEPVAHFEPYTLTRPGEILCKRGKSHQAHEFRLTCRRCAKEMGVDKVEGVRKK